MLGLGRSGTGCGRRTPASYGRCTDPFGCPWKSHIPFLGIRSSEYPFRPPLTISVYVARLSPPSMPLNRPRSHLATRGREMPSQRGDWLGSSLGACWDGGAPRNQFLTFDRCLPRAVLREFVGIVILCDRLRLCVTTEISERKFIRIFQFCH